MTRPQAREHSFAIAFLCLLGVLLALFHNSLDPAKVVFSNDGPLGALNQQAFRLPAAFTGAWQDLNVIGNNGGAATCDITQGLFWLLGPLAYAKFYAPATLLILGLGASFFFRRLGLSPLASILGGLAAMLNSAYFSAACWGVGPQTISIGFIFFALGALVSNPPRWRALKYIVAGFGVGMAVTEGADVGALFSVIFAAYVFYSALISNGPGLHRVARGIGRVALVTVFAAFLAAQTMSVLIGTNIKGIAGTEQDAQSKAARWDFATQWSLPKLETLGLIVPGLFGYRMDTPDGGNYWGRTGRDPAWDRYFASGREGQPPPGFIRYSGGSGYEGVLVALVSLWAAIQSFRRRNSVFTLDQRKLIWFWVGVAILALLLAFGRYAPFYQLAYALPYFSAIRNPAKFIGILNWALLVLFAYGVHGLSRRYLEVPAPKPAGWRVQCKAWWAKVNGFDRNWTLGLIVAMGAGVLGWLIYASSRARLESYLQAVQFDESTAHAIAAFSIRQAGAFVVLLILSAGLIILVVSGCFAGQRAKWAGILLGLLLVVDLGRANLPWILYWDYSQKYATNPVIDLLRQHPYEHRVAIVPFQPPAGLLYFNQLYEIEWKQHHFLYYNVQTLDVVQMPRKPADLDAFDRATMQSLPALLRRWELTNTRYLLGPAGFLDGLNREVDPARHRFRILTRFDIVPKTGFNNSNRSEDWTAALSTNGQLAVFEFTGALPRAGLYSNWQVAADDPAALAELKTNTLSASDAASLKQWGTNDFLTLKELVSPSFDPQQTVLLASPLPAPAPVNATNQNAGTVRFASYATKDIVFDAQATTPSVLLLNDKYDPDWKVTVDGRPAGLLRCNFIMRGVFLTPGTHRVEFQFNPPVAMLYVSMAAVGMGILLAGCLVYLTKERA